MDRRLFGLALVTVLLYAPTVGYGYVYEDWNDLETFSRPWPLSGEAWTHRLRMPTRLLRDVSFTISGTDPAAAHLGNVVVHLVNGLLLYAVAVPLVGAGGAVFAAGLFWLHPVQVESVAYISSRADLVAVLCVLVAVLCRARVWWCLLACVGAVLAKETFVMVLMIPLWTGLVRPNRPLLAVWLLLAVPSAGYLLMAFGRAPDLYQGLVTLTQLSQLLLLWIWPVGQTIDHDWARLTMAHVFATAAIWVVFGTYAVLYRPRWGWALGVTLVLYLPRLLVPLSEGLHEHHLYGPSVALSLAAAGWGLRKETHRCAAI